MLTGTATPLLSKAAGLAGDIQGLQGVLDNVYREMLPMCSQLIGVARGIAGFGATPRNRSLIPNSSTNTSTGWLSQYESRF